MNIQLSATVEGTPVTIQLPDDLNWQERHSWSPVGQTATRTALGSLVIQSRAMVAGRPITLAPFDDQTGWVTLSVLEQMRNLAAIAGLVLQLTIDSEVFDVVFRHHEGSAIEYEAVAEYTDYEPGDFFYLTAKFMTI